MAAVKQWTLSMMTLTSRILRRKSVNNVPQYVRRFSKSAIKSPAALGSNRKFASSSIGDGSKPAAPIFAAKPPPQPAKAPGGAKPAPGGGKPPPPGAGPAAEGEKPPEKPSDPCNPQNLPKQPVPCLDETFARYLISVQPLLSDTEFCNTCSITKKYQAGDAVKLQEILEKRKKEMLNWMACWWLHAAYLDYRVPVVVHSSPGMVFPDCTFCKLEHQLTYAAKMIRGAMDYKNLIDNKKLKVDMQGNTPLDMQQYEAVFGTCRIPAEKHDCLLYYPKSQHIVVAYQNEFFKVAVYDCNCCLANEEQILQALKLIMTCSKKGAPPLGILTSDTRDDWAKSFKILCENKENRKCMEAIHQAQFLVCLDGPISNHFDYNRKSTAARMCLHGGGSDGNSGNRWFDKTLQLIIGCDGLNGICYEHSPAEGQPVAVLTDYIIDYMAKNELAPAAESDIIPEPLCFTVCDKIKEAIDKAKKKIDEMDCNLVVQAFQFRGFGKTFIKGLKQSPDSFIQMAMQIAFYRMHKIPGVQYEAAAMRMYVQGRTEAIRSCSKESVAMACAVCDPKVSQEDKAKKIIAAINSHKAYTSKAVQGCGCDRHLMGLRKAALESDMKPDPFYEDLGWKKSTHFRVSTSQVASKCDGFMAFGPVQKDGYGVCYNPRDEDINFAITSFRDCCETTAHGFRAALEDSLYDMQDALGGKKDGEDEKKDGDGPGGKPGGKPPPGGKPAGGKPPPGGKPAKKAAPSTGTSASMVLSSTGGSPMRTMSTHASFKNAEQSTSPPY